MHSTNTGNYGQAVHAGEKEMAMACIIELHAVSVISFLQHKSY